MPTRHMAGRPMASAVPTKAYMIVFTDNSEGVNVFTITKNMTIGRPTPDNEPDIELTSPIASRKQGEITVSAGNFFYTDSNSLNGTFINGTLINSDTPIKLNDGDVLRIDSQKESTTHKNAVTIVFSQSYDRRSKWHKIPLSPSGQVLGRTHINTLSFDPGKIQTPLVRIFGNKGTFKISPIGRTSEFLKINNRPITSEITLNGKDVVRLGRDYMFFSQNEAFYSVASSAASGLGVHINETTVSDSFGKKTLLKDIHMHVNHGDFTLIIGGSGAGKSTLINSILGKYKISGAITLEGRPVTAGSTEAARIAYVPQTLPLRKEERLIDVVRDTALLRMNGNMSPKEREAFIQETLDQLGLKSKAKMEIRKLSGGEQRRAAIANEVVTNSDIFFLDEPDSGLDPKSGIELMHNLHALSEKGKIVMLISHNYASYPEPEKIYSKVIILAKSNIDGIGRLAFMGTIKEALDFFEVEALKDITKLINPKSENGDGRADEFVEKYRRMYES